MPQISERSWFVFVVKVCTFKPFSCTQVSGSNDLHASKTTLVLVSEISWVPLLSKVLFQLELSIMWRFSQMHFWVGWQYRLCLSWSPLPQQTSIWSFFLSSFL